MVVWDVKNEKKPVNASVNAEKYNCKGQAYFLAGNTSLN